MTVRGKQKTGGTSQNGKPSQESVGRGTPQRVSHTGPPTRGPDNVQVSNCGGTERLGELRQNGEAFPAIRHSGSALPDVCSISDNHDHRQALSAILRRRSPSRKPGPADATHPQRYPNRLLRMHADATQSVKHPRTHPWGSTATDVTPEASNTSAGPIWPRLRDDAPPAASAPSQHGQPKLAAA